MTSALPLPVAESPAGSGRAAGPMPPLAWAARPTPKPPCCRCARRTVAGRGAAPRHPGAGPDGAVPDRRRRAFARLAAAAAGGAARLPGMGLVVNVESMAALTALRRLAPGLTLSPASGDDLAPAPGPAPLPGAHHRHRRRAVGAQMAQPHAVEVLLRPAVELHTVAVCTGAAILCWWHRGRSR